jgi:catechol 2,3-dioxygenase-like lactoylglutathione lyase family enzyme
MAKVSHIVLPVSDVSRSREWYVNKLGFTLGDPTRTPQIEFTPPARFGSGLVGPRLESTLDRDVLAHYGVVALVYASPESLFCPSSPLLMKIGCGNVEISRSVRDFRISTAASMASADVQPRPGNHRLLEQRHQSKDQRVEPQAGQRDERVARLRRADRIVAHCEGCSWA